MVEFIQGDGPRLDLVSYVPVAPWAAGALAPAFLPLEQDGQAGAASDVALTQDNLRDPQGAEWDAAEARLSAPLADFFDDVHVVPREFDIGNLLSPQSIPIEVYNAYRTRSVTWGSFTNNAGAGTDLAGVPALPTVILEANGVVMSLELTLAGPPLVDDTLDFDFGADGTTSTLIKLQRVTLIAPRPEGGFTEVLSFLTDVTVAQDGTRKAASLRLAPVSTYDLTYRLDEGNVAQTVENLIFDAMERSVGVPVWFDATYLTVDIASGDTIINLEGTEFRDFVVDGLAVILADDGTFDVLQIAAITATTIEFTAPVVNSYTAGMPTEVFPLATCNIPRSYGGRRWPANLQELRIAFERTDYVRDLSDLSAFESFEGRLLLADVNSMASEAKRFQVREDFTILDNGAGFTYRASALPGPNRSVPLRIRAKGREAAWRLRQLAHAIRGRQKTFFVARSSDDLTPIADALAGGASLECESVGYARYVRAAAPKDVARITFVDGRTPIVNRITTASETAGGTDLIEFADVWPYTFTPAEVARIEYVERVACESDDLRLVLDPSDFVVHLEVNVETVR